ncbi:MAG: hypothetical protein JWQ95_1649 [Sphaerisporangium sp.]|nr:hypothetical protein [Sphaerisporangium sp.]
MTESPHLGCLWARHGKHDTQSNHSAHIGFPPGYEPFERVTNVLARNSQSGIVIVVSVAEQCPNPFDQVRDQL